jgi:tetratricopeptide (TPR) repeat protein
MGHPRVWFVCSALTVGIALVARAPLAEAMPVPSAQAGAKATAQARLKQISADLFTRTDRVDSSIRELKEILAVDPGSAEAHLLLGVAYRALGAAEMMAEAVAELRQALALNPSLAPARLYLAYVYLDLGRAARAREELQAALAAAPDNPQFLALLAESERQLKNPARAVELLQPVLQRDASFAQARYYLGLALFDLGRREEATKELERLVASGVKVADAYLSLGVLYLDAGRLDEGLEILSQSTHIDPARADLRIQLARAYRLKGALDKAEEQLTVAERASLGLGSPFAQHQQADFDLSIELGLVRMQRGDYRAAVTLFQKALTMDPTHAPTQRHLADAKRKLQQKPTSLHEQKGGGRP